MKRKQLLSIISIVFVVSFIFFEKNVHASVIPTLSLSNITSVSTQVSVHGDPNASIELHYGSNASVVASNFGTTDANGNFSTVINTSSYNISCNQTAYIVINSQMSATISWAPSAGCTTTSSNISFSQNNIILNAGQSQTITISGTGGYSITTNTNTGVVTPSISGSTLNLYALAFGGANLTICQSDGQCGIVYVVVTNTTNGQQNNQLPALSSFNISSNNTNGGFMSPGNVMTLSFSTTEPVSNVSVIMGTSNLQVSGSGSTFSATYSIPQDEPLPIPVRISFTDTTGNNGQANFGLGNVTPSSTPINYNSNSIPAGCTSTAGFSATTGQPCGNGSIAIVTTPATTPTPVVASVASGHIFSQFLNVNTTGSEVTELQKRLTALGFYSGPITGRFGSLTETAVKKLQKAHGINQAGYVGPSTRAILNQY